MWIRKQSLRIRIHISGVRTTRASTLTSPSTGVWTRTLGQIVSNLWSQVRMDWIPYLFLNLWPSPYRAGGNQLISLLFRIQKPGLRIRIRIRIWSDPDLFGRIRSRIRKIFTGSGSYRYFDNVKLNKQGINILKIEVLHIFRWIFPFFQIKIIIIQISEEIGSPLYGPTWAHARRRTK